MIRALKKGLYTSIQDLGRVGYRNYGVPVSGVMDYESAILSNAILGNVDNDAVMEITLQGPRLLFLTGTKITITGADLSPTLNEQIIQMSSRVAIQKGDIIDFGKRKSGVRCYLAVSGGFQTETALNSRSFYQGITKQSTIGKGDEVSFNSSFGADTLQLSQPLKSMIDFHQQDLEVHKGPEYDLLNEHQRQELVSNTFNIGLNNRMAYQLEQPLDNQMKSILSSAVLPGTIQLTPSGKMIVLMRDCQTTGGYPRVLQLSDRAISMLSQKMQGESVSFKLINLHDMTSGN